MGITKKILLAGAGFGALVATAGAAIAASETFTASIEVTNSITFTEVTPLSFGVFAFLDDGATAAVATLGAGGTWTTATAPNVSKLVQIGTPTAGEVTMYGGTATYMTFNVSFPDSAGFTLGNPSPIADDFTVTAFQIAAPVAGDISPDEATLDTLAECNDELDDNSVAAVASLGDYGCKFLTDANGMLTLKFGATITGATGNTYPAGSYTGSYTISADYY